VWVTPFLQPDSVLIGIVLAIGTLNRLPAWVFPAAFLLAGWQFASYPPPWVSTSAAAISYPLAAILCVSLIETVRRFTILRAIFSLPLVVFLGTISFGLYVFHLFGIYCAQIIFSNLGWPLNIASDLANYWAYAASALAVTTAISTFSYYSFEKPFLWLKDRFATVHGRISDQAVPVLLKEEQGSIAQAQP
jgi:peptidoglycan/LPS O-acetylase OafA/YrhL